MSYALAVALIAACGSSHPKTGDAAVDTAVDGPPDAKPVTVTVTLIDRPNAPATFAFLSAYADGTGAWQLAPPPNGDNYTFEVTADMWSFAWTCVTPTDREVQIYQFLFIERRSLVAQIPASCTDRTQTPVALSGAISNPPAGTIAVAWGDRSVDAVASSYTFDPGVDPGTHDLVGVHRAVSGSSYVVDSAVVQRGLAVTAATTQAIDFAGAPATQTAQISGVPSNALMFSGVLMAGGTYQELSFFTSPPASGGYVAVGLNASQAAAGDVYAVLVDEPVSGGSVSIEAFTSAPRAFTFVAPSPLSGLSSTVAATAPYPQIKTTWTKYANATGYTWSAAAGAQWDAFIGPGAAGNSPAFQMPDLSTLTGWDPRLALQTGMMAPVLVGAQKSTGDGDDFPPVAAPTAGTARAHAHAGSQVQL